MKFSCPCLPAFALLLLAATPVAFAAGETPAFFTEVAVLAVVGALIAYISFRLGLIPIVGFLIAGVIIGPNALGLVQDRELIDAAAELGVILLLFTIGIEFSLEKLARIQRLIFVGGGVQVGLVLVLTTLVLVPFGISWQAAVFTGCLVALSSTAIVLKLLSDKGETGSDPGQIGVGVLIFQDLAVVVMVLLVPFLGGEGGSSLDILWALTKAVGIVVGILLLARRVMPRILEAVARTCSSEIFLLSVVGICFGTAYLTSLADVSLSLGAFLAGLLVSESRFGQQALGEILPLRIIFSAAFFISVGLLLDLGFLVTNLPLVLAVVLVVLALKILTTAVGARLLGYTTGTALASGFLLAQIGEFSFVLERAGRAVGLAPAGLAEVGPQTFIAATVLTMGVTPFLANVGQSIERRLSAKRPTGTPKPSATGVAESVDADLEAFLETLDHHVIVAGYGVWGERLATALKASERDYLVVTLSPDGANEAERDGHPVLFGDYSRNFILELAGVERAASLVVADDDLEMTHRTVAVTRLVSPELCVVARVDTAAEAHELHESGASLVVADEYASAQALLTRVLEPFDVHAAKIDELTEKLFLPSAAHTSSEVSRSKPVSVLPVSAATSTAKATPNAPSTVKKLSLPERKGDMPTCDHVAQTRTVVADTRGCEACLKQGTSWVHLRVCLSCGFVGCCDSSPGQHASAHFHETGHPIMMSGEAGETWGWCFVDGLEL